MVIICNENYPSDNEATYKSFFENYSFPLSNFQKYSIESIVTGNHVLVNVPTGSGKTLCGEFAIEYFTKQNKKVIYTTPIKALSNQKFHDFTIKYPDLSIGILTGDIKTNPDGEVLIMTAEILKNKLTQLNPNTDFDIDIENELGCVIMDEVHYINDKERGKVWEETIMLLPKHIQIVMLSATLDKPEYFASWVEHKGDFSNQNIEKQVYVTPKVQRIVPLNHFFFITNSNDIYKQTKSKEMEQKIKKINNKLLLMQDDKNKFDCNNKIKEIKDVLDIYSSKNYFAKRSFVINECIKQLKEKEILPALFFVLSKKNIDVIAHEITIPLFNKDCTIPNTIAKECEKIIRKLPNYKEILGLDEYINAINLLQKGIAVHHAGVLPVIREMIEILFGKGYIKILLATETFAVGINMPTKAVVFTGLTKFDGTNHRLLHSHEYTQMAGRAGRRGIDTKGYVIHLINLYKNVNIFDYKQVMKDEPQSLQSSFNVEYSMVLESMDNPNLELQNIIRNSLVNKEFQIKIKDIELNIQNLNNQIISFRKRLGENLSVIGSFVNKQEELKGAINSRRKKLQKELDQIKKQTEIKDTDIKLYKEYDVLESSISSQYLEKEHFENYLQNQKNKAIQILKELNLLNEDNTLSQMGKVAIQIKEMDSILGSYLVTYPEFTKLTTEQIIIILSTFVDIPTPEEERTLNPNCIKLINNILERVKELNDQKLDLETKFQYLNHLSSKINYDLIEYCQDWVYSTNEAECKLVLNKLVNEKQIYLGDFNKILIKITNISKELENVCELTGNMELKSKLNQIPEFLLKYVVTMQSLYV